MLKFPRLSMAWLIFAAGMVCLPACQGDGNFTIFGYTTEPQYDRSIKTVYVPIFKNQTMRRGLEFQLTQAVIREIEAKTPYKVVAKFSVEDLSDSDRADTILEGKIISMNKNILNRNQNNEVREAETALAVEVVWKNQRTGEVLTRPGGRQGPPSTPSLPVLNAPAAATPPPTPPPALVQSIATFIPEIGESITTAEKFEVDRLAVQIVSMMEKPW